MKKWLFALALGLLLALVAYAGSDDVATTETDEPIEEESEVDESNDEEETGETDEVTEIAERDVVEPEDIYKESCASCHSGNFDFGEGMSICLSKKLKA